MKTAVSLLRVYPSLKKRRDTTRVIYDLLSLSKDGVSKTQMVNRANLNFRLAKPYLAFLQDKGMLQVNKDDRGASFLELTSKGEHFLSYLTTIEQELREIFPSWNGTRPTRLTSFEDQVTNGFDTRGRHVKE